MSFSFPPFPKFNFGEFLKTNPLTPIAAGTLAETYKQNLRNEKHLKATRVIQTEEAKQKGFISIEDYARTQIYENDVSPKVVTEKVKYHYSKMSRKEQAQYLDFDLNKNQTEIVLEKSIWNWEGEIKIRKKKVILEKTSNVASITYSSSESNFSDQDNFHEVNNCCRQSDFLIRNASSHKPVYTVAAQPFSQSPIRIIENSPCFEDTIFFNIILYAGCFVYIQAGVALNRKILTGSFFSKKPTAIKEIVLAYKKEVLSVNQASFLLTENHNMSKITALKTLKNEILE